MAAIKPCLWFDGAALEAAEFYVSVFPGSRVTSTVLGPVDWPGGRAGDVLMVDFRLAGRDHQALNGGPYTEFNESISLSVTCDGQAEVDRVWRALLEDGGAELQCGWLRDRFGLRWQIVPAAMEDMLRNADPDRLTRVMSAMMTMVKLDEAALKRAHDG